MVIGSWSRGEVFRATAGTSARLTSSGKGKCNGKSAQEEAEQQCCWAKPLEFALKGRRMKRLKD